MSDLEKRLDALSSRQRVLLDLRLAREGGSHILSGQTIPRREEDGPCPLTVEQEHLWLVQQLFPENAAYNISNAYHFAGRLRIAAVNRSLSEIVRRHEILRTAFVADGGGPVQVVLPAELLTVPIVDLSGLGAAASRTERTRLLVQRAQQPFDLASGRPLRFTLLRLGEHEVVFLITMHHIATDWWSFDIVLREFLTLYGSLSRGRRSTLPELPIQFGDFAAWQRQRLQGEVLDRYLSYWREALEGAPPMLELPTDRARPAVAEHRGARYFFVPPAGVLEVLRALSRQRNVTLFATLLAAFATLLQYQTGQDDILIGTPLADRNRSEIEGLIGYFLNLLILRADLTRDPSFRCLIDRLRGVILGAYDHQDLPFTRLVQELKSHRSLSHSVLFQVAFIYVLEPEGAGPSSGLPGVAVSQEGMDPGTARFDLTLVAEDKLDGFFFFLEYSTELFDVSTIGRLAGHLNNLLARVAADAECNLSRLSFLSAAERFQLRTEWNDTSSTQPGNPCVHELFEACVEHNPSAVAVVFEDAMVSYRGLDQGANRLAHRLRTLGVGPEIKVAIHVERSLDMVIAVLAVLKAGGAYVPFDPALPPERFVQLLKDSGAAVLLTGPRPRDLLPGFGGTEIRLDEEREVLRSLPVSCCPSGAGSGNLAYMIYTSGSTGRPKGVAVSHRALVNFLASMRERPGLGPRDRVLAVTPLSFDISALELFLPLIRGARVELVGREIVADGERLQERLRRATVLQATPATWQLLLATGWTEGGGLKALCGGEALSPRLAAELVARTSSAWNLYGPTETTVWSSVQAVTAAETEGAAVAIGRPIANTRFLVVDRDLRTQPVGVPGELLVGGSGLARGYHARPSLNAESFVPDPFAVGPGERLYRSGDLVCWRGDSGMDFLGRIDRQVKMRGFRIEPGEIEAVLENHPTVREAVVLIREDLPQDLRLVAYVVPEAGQIPDGRVLRQYLAEKLPNYMVPASWMVLQALPLTPNGKVDLRVLPLPPRHPSGAEVPRGVPWDVVAGLLVAIWEEVLRVDRFTIHDNFFELGGHSLLATLVTSRVRHVFGVEVPLRIVFENPTVVTLAASIERRLQGGRLESPPIVAVSRQGAPLSFAQQRLWFIDRLQPGGSAYNMPTALHLRGALRPEVLERCFREVVRRHEVLRTSFATAADGEPVQKIAAAVPVPVPVLDLSALPRAGREREIPRLAREEARWPFDLAQGPILRVRLIRSAPEDHVLLVTVHHIASDAWSMKVLTFEVTALYEAFSAGCPSPLVELAVQYRDYAVWQRDWLQGEVLEVKLAAWRNRLRGTPLVLALPLDRPRPAIQRFFGSSFPLALHGELLAALMGLGRSQSVTLFMILLAAFQAFLYRLSGQRDIPVGTPIAGRNRLELEELIGCLVNTLVLRGDLSGDPSFLESLGRARDVSLEAYTHQELPFEKLVEELQPERSLSYPPLFQVMLALQNTGSRVPAPGGETGLRWSVLDPPEDIAKFELTLTIEERGGQLRGTMTYNTDLFDGLTIRRMSDQFVTLLRSILEDPEARISCLPLLAAPERFQLLTEWNDASTTVRGRPVSPRIFLLDASLSLAPIGVTGELLIDGSQAPWDDLDRPGLTAEKFIPDPYGNTEGGRLYRTADLARFSVAGEIEFAGHKDPRVELPDRGQERPDQERSGQEREAVPAPPRSELEQTVTAVWKEVLGIEEIGRRDNFFDLGGHSMLLLRAHAKLRPILGVDLSMMVCFQYPTIGALADYLSRSSRAPSFEDNRTRAKARKAAMAGQRQRRPSRRRGG